MIHRTLCACQWLTAVACCGLAAADQQVLYEKDSAYSTIVVTEDDQGLRTLWFGRDGARQSVVKLDDPDHIELPYARAMPVGLAFAGAPRRVLIVGLGGGTIPTFLHQHYPQTMIDVVDIDPDVVDVAKRYFGFREDATLRAHVADGRHFIEQHAGAYDMLFLDAFGSDGIPYQLATREFLLAVRRAVVPQGVVIADIWGRHSNPLYDSMVRTYQDVFDELYIFDVQGAGNKILVALPRAEHIQQNELARRASAISTAKEFAFDLGEIVRHGYRNAGQLDARGHILTDQGQTNAGRPQSKANDAPLPLRNR